ncbi:unnamed protein product [Didymodactylos carnosus]|uniref:G-protein coupled receptors family 1 profile domain-containing protein n=1 Tax=Didymodactylos carnosus TaxID=1234261 RepID=A0A813NWM2_9BILA|nr:unnamed protein product [Didymodactylos carnosus]CAF1090965.1 unnamed protein product [Didymodactylos carnosus]CAF3518162.1 unnamed protein product [Didymodactylos carnosus]CAF3852626.1 unnamed protein product [Didymodactylos carnosus]
MFNPPEIDYHRYYRPSSSRIITTNDDTSRILTDSDPLWKFYSYDPLLSISAHMPFNDTMLITTNTSSSSFVNSSSIQQTEDDASNALLYLIVPIYSLVFVTGTIGNILVILTVLTVKQMRTTTNALVLHLAIANLSFVLLCIPHTLYVYVATSYRFPKAICKVTYTMMYLSAYVSIYILVLMSVDRFLGVVLAVKSTRFRTQRNAHIAVSIVWLFGIIFASSNMFVYDVIPYEEHVFCTTKTDVPFLNLVRKISAYCFALLGLFIPLALIAVLYGLIINTLRKNAKGKQVQKGKKRVTKMVSAVISSFVICWSPMQIYLLYTQVYSQTIISLAIIAQILVYISSCINPILYAFLSEPFRKAFQQFLTCSKIKLITTDTMDNTTKTTGRKESSILRQKRDSKAKFNLPPKKSHKRILNNSSENVKISLSNINENTLMIYENTEYERLSTK